MSEPQKSEVGTPGVEEILDSVEELEPLPHIVPRVMELVRNPEAKVSQLAEVLSQDQALTARILKLANSAFYGFPRRITTITDAVVLLGFNTIKGLVYAVALYDNLDQAIEGYGMARGQIWKHSLATAVAARQISKDTGIDSPEEAFVSGLLHDIGKTVLNSYVSELFEHIYQTALEQGLSFAEAEQQVLGFDHAELGARVVDHWNLPEKYAHAIRNMYRPLEASDGKLAAIVHLANTASLMLGVGIGVDGYNSEIEDEIFELIGKDRDYLSDLLDELDSQLVDLESLASLGEEAA